MSMTKTIVIRFDKNNDMQKQVNANNLSSNFRITYFLIIGLKRSYCHACRIIFITTFTDVQFEAINKLLNIHFY